MALVLNRRLGETVVLRWDDQEIVVKVVEIRGWQSTRLALHAPKHVTILRGEIDGKQKDDTAT